MFARTTRLLLRPGWAEDAHALTLAIGDEAVVRNLARAPWPYAFRDAQAHLAASRDANLPKLLIFERGDAPMPRLVGGCGLTRDASGTIELGYWIARPYWNRGYATEAGEAVLGMAKALGIRKLEAGHFIDNPASGRVLQKLGFRATGRTRERYSRGRGVRAASLLYERKDGGDSQGDRMAPPAQESLTA